jgi:hypothetical protein
MVKPTTERYSNNLNHIANGSGRAYDQGGGKGHEKEVALVSGHVFLPPTPFIKEKLQWQARLWNSRN